MTINVLSVDGGGIRGVGTAHILEEFEKRLGAPLHEAFQLFVGTSTGAILAGGLAAKGMSAAEIKALYRKDGKKMFVRSFLGSLEHGLFRAKYKTERKGETLKSILGELTLGKIERNFLGTFYDIGDQPGPVFANGGPDYRAKREPDDKYHDWPLWAVINASSSAPMYFDPAPFEIGGRTVLGVDGGLFANNPTMCAFVEARNLFGTDDINVVSAGTGLSKLSFPRRKRWGLITWGSPFDHVPMMEAMFDGQSSTVSHQVEQVLGQRSFRFEFSLDKCPHVTMDDVSIPNQDAILKAADDYLKLPDTQTLLNSAVAAVRAKASAMPVPKMALPPGTPDPSNGPN